MRAVLQSVHRIAAEVVSAHAASVDAESRFPVESIAALKQAGLLGALVPQELGGMALDFATVLAICHLLGRHCASTAMIFAMHQIQVACVLLHRRDVAWQRDFLGQIAGRQLLLASATTEAGIGGDLSRSSCAVIRDGDRFTIEKRGTVISYGDQADAVLITARSGPDAQPTDQVIVVALKDQYVLEKTGGWDALGMRGTCSNSYVLRAAGHADQVIPEPYADISPRTMVPVAHLTWSSLWLGIATDAVSRARAFVRKQKQPAGEGMPPSMNAMRLAAAVSQLQAMKANIVAAARQYENALKNADGVTALSFSIAMNNVKTSTAYRAVEVINQAMLICGIAGYKNDTPFSLGRHLRDAHSAALMVNNDRIDANTASLLRVHKLDGDLFD
ncbi:MAG TPA: acyl-CoA dehydrogenase family protein [Dongiaceae bacterium]|jgi:acyl-CoA dehydrogenase|nr:acyl-CoA dehydrogenase family protein [Dongiaceae bacterium]